MIYFISILILAFKRNLINNNVYQVSVVSLVCLFVRVRHFEYRDLSTSFQFSIVSIKIPQLTILDLIQRRACQLSVQSVSYLIQFIPTTRKDKTISTIINGIQIVTLFR